MPLKHDTETWLTFLLGLMIALAGIVSAFLPPVSVSVFPWAIAFALSIAYPLLLYPMLRSRRADYPFRLLHFVPALILLLWLIFELLASALPSLQFLQTWYTLGWSAGAVILFFLLLMIFCLRVIRQRMKRIGLLLAVLVPFLLLGFWSDTADWDRRLLLSALNGGASGNLLPSKDPLEEQWRIELRLMEQRRQQLLRGETGGLVGFDIAAPGRGIQITSSGLGPQTVTGDSIPPRLPSSGFGMEGVAIVFLAMTSAAIHRRTMARGRAGRV